MAGRGPQTLQKRQKEQRRRERQQEKFAKRLLRKQEKHEFPPIEQPDAADAGTGEMPEPGDPIPS